MAEYSTFVGTEFSLAEVEQTTGRLCSDQRPNGDGSEGTLLLLQNGECLERDRDPAPVWSSLQRDGDLGDAKTG